MAALSPASILGQIRGHDEAIERLREAARADRVAQAYLFHGPRGVGKTRTALGFAQLLNCIGPEPPCGACAACRKVGALIHPDVRLLFPATRDEESHPEDLGRRLEEYGADRYHLLEFARNASIGIEKIRELKAEAAMSHAEGKRRVYILVEAQRMLEDAAQSALKLIEEPPPGTHLILTVEEPASLLPTIVSRCQQVRFRPLQRAAIGDLLARDIGLDLAASGLIAALADGSLGRALELKQESSIVQMRDAAVRMLDVTSDPREIREKVGEWSKGLDPNTTRRNAELLLMWCHDLLCMKVGLPPESLLHADRQAELSRRAESLSVPTIRAWVDALEEWVTAADRNVHPMMAFHETLTRIADASDAAAPPTRRPTEGRKVH
jgi:DNA polymerase-3 subunit delta'